MPTLTQTAPSTPTPLAGAPALRVPHMVLQAADQSYSLEIAGSRHISSARVQSAQSSAPSSARPQVAPSIATRTPSEQAVTQALQAVAIYQESRDVVELMSRTLYGLQTLLDVPLQLESCMLASQGSRAQYVGGPQCAVARVHNVTGV